MGIYNFKKRFVPYVLDGSKTHTIRAERRHPDAPGRTMHLYSGLRTKNTQLLMRVRCVKTEFIRFEEDGRVRIGARIDLENPDDIGGAAVQGGFIDLDEQEKSMLAWRDGFRPSNSTQNNPGNSFELMMGYWKDQSKGLPFEGVILHWSSNPVNVCVECAE